MKLYLVTKPVILSMFLKFRWFLGIKILFLNYSTNIRNLLAFSFSISFLLVSYFDFSFNPVELGIFFYVFNVEYLKISNYTFAFLAKWIYCLADHLVKWWLILKVLTSTYLNYHLVFFLINFSTIKLFCFLFCSSCS